MPALTATTPHRGEGLIARYRAHLPVSEATPFVSLWRRWHAADPVPASQRAGWGGDARCL